MKASEYVGTITVKDYVVNIGIDDYGQCYFAEWEENDELCAASLGTYCTDFLEATCSLFDYKGVSISLYGKEQWDLDTERQKQRHISSGWAESDPLGFKNWLDNRNTEDYCVYDFEKMYEEFQR